jgi:hypothetical protein
MELLGRETARSPVGCSGGARLGRVIRDIRRKISGNEAPKERFADLLALAV